MTDDEELKRLLSVLPKEIEPPVHLVDNTVSALQAAGLLRESARVSIFNTRPFFAAGLIAAAFVAGIFVAPHVARTPKEPSFVLLLYGGNHTGNETAEKTQAAEYAAWAGSVSGDARVVGGEELALAPADLADPNALVGYFLVDAPGQQFAQRVANTCPHLKYGGRVVVREIRRR